MKIEVTNRGQDAIISLKAETWAENLQRNWLLDKGRSLGMDVFEFTGWDDDEGGISFVVKLK